MSIKNTSVTNIHFALSVNVPASEIEFWGIEFQPPMFAPLGNGLEIMVTVEIIKGKESTNNHYICETTFVVVDYSLNAIKTDKERKFMVELYKAALAHARIEIASFRLSNNLEVLPFVPMIADDDLRNEIDTKISSLLN